LSKHRSRETQMLSQRQNLTALMNHSGQRIDTVH
jgi:hypothetical protein